MILLLGIQCISSSGIDSVVKYAKPNNIYIYIYKEIVISFCFRDQAQTKENRLDCSSEEEHIANLTNLGINDLKLEDQNPASIEHL